MFLLIFVMIAVAATENPRAAHLFFFFLWCLLFLPLPSGDDSAYFAAQKKGL